MPFKLIKMINLIVHFWQMNSGKISIQTFLEALLNLCAFDNVRSETLESFLSFVASFFFCHFYYRLDALDEHVCVLPYWYGLWSIGVAAQEYDLVLIMLILIHTGMICSRLFFN